MAAKDTLTLVFEKRALTMMMKEPQPAVERASLQQQAAAVAAETTIEGKWNAVPEWARSALLKVYNRLALDTSDLIDLGDALEQGAHGWIGGALPDYASCALFLEEDDDGRQHTLH